MISGGQRRPVRHTCTWLRRLRRVCSTAKKFWPSRRVASAVYLHSIAPSMCARREPKRGRGCSLAITSVDDEQPPALTLGLSTRLFGERKFNVHGQTERLIQFNFGSETH